MPLFRLSDRLVAAKIYYKYRSAFKAHTGEGVKLQRRTIQDTPSHWSEQSRLILPAQKGGNVKPSNPSKAHTSTRNAPAAVATTLTIRAGQRNTRTPPLLHRSKLTINQRSIDLLLLSAFPPEPALPCSTNASSAWPSSSTPHDVSAACCASAASSSAAKASNVGAELCRSNRWWDGGEKRLARVTQNSPGLEAPQECETRVRYDSKRGKASKHSYYHMSTPRARYVPHQTLV